MSSVPVTLLPRSPRPIPTVVGLYVDRKGPYWSLLGHENVWMIERDARLYDGPHPVVAHPPCGPWGRLKHQYKGTEHDCAPRAVEQVRACGGVLEHPAGSLLWDECFFESRYNFPLPEPGLSDPCGFTIEINQCDFGHVARKRTWLYIVGLRPSQLPPMPEPREPTHWVSGRKQTEAGTALAREKGWLGGAAPAGIKICSALQRRITPVAFAEWLIEVARRVGEANLAKRGLPT